MITTKTEITVSLVAEDKRLDFFPRYVGRRWMMQFEMRLYRRMEQLCSDYKGGYWNFYELSNSGFYLAPKATRTFLMASPNYATEEVSADAAGIIATIFALNELMFIMDDGGDSGIDDIITRYYALRDFAAEHPESSKIFAIID